MNDFQPPIPDPIAPLTNVPPSPPEGVPARTLVARTMREAVLLAAISLPIAAVLRALKITFLLPSEANQQGMAFLAQVNPLLLLLLAVIAAPVIEETLFRGLPFGLLRLISGKKQGQPSWLPVNWILGIIAAILFSLAHGLGDETGAHHLALPQLMVGLWSWRVVNTRGLRYSMLLHATYNAIPTLLVLLMKVTGQPIQ